MLFNSYEFILLFLPLTLLVYYRIGGISHHRVAIAWLVGASLFFYAWWNPAYLYLMLFSIIFNYTVGVSLSGKPSKFLLATGIAANLALLGYYKYANFFVDNINHLVGSDFNLGTILLPLAISFFTFQQIAYLMDAYRGETREYNFLHYCLFVTFFPQLIAGPIVHHREMLPQFAKAESYLYNHSNLAIGLTIFAIGLFKKVGLADNIAVYATPVFDAAEAGTALSFFDAWSGALAYTFQLYFDFSGYSDMAIGLARMFGIRLPLNFHSPYKADNIIDFWRRWHMTLSRFLRDYLYIPLGGNRKGNSRRHINLMITMLLGGLWHGAGWTFIIWGGLHGLYLIINHMWHGLRKSWGHDLTQHSVLGRWSGRILTFLAVVVAWVFFRAESVDSAMIVLQGMAGTNGIIISDSYAEKYAFLSNLGVQFGQLDIIKGRGVFNGILLGLILIWFLPNTQQLMARYQPAFDTYKEVSTSSWQGRLQWKPSTGWAISIGIISALGLFMVARMSEFLYFQF